MLSCSQKFPIHCRILHMADFISVTVWAIIHISRFTYQIDCVIRNSVSPFTSTALWQISCWARNQCVHNASREIRVLNTTPQKQGVLILSSPYLYNTKLLLNLRFSEAFFNIECTSRLAKCRVANKNFLNTCTNVSYTTS